MGKKILSTLTNNLLYKILALLLAFVLWLVVYNIDDPNVTKTFTASISITNGDALTNKNLYYEVTDSTSVKVAVTGKRSVMQNIDDSDITATADMNRAEISEDGKTASVPLEFFSMRSNSQLTINSTSSILHFALEALSTKKIKVEAEVTGKPGKGYATSSDLASVEAPTVMTISGPTSIVEKIKTCRATIDVSNLGGQGMDTITDYAVPQVYDENGKQIDSSKLKFSNSRVTVKVEICNTKTVPVKFSTSGKPGNELGVIGIDQSVASVEIKGSAAALNSVSAIEVPANVLSVEGAVKTFSTTVDINEYLPDGVTLVDRSQAQIVVTVQIEEIEEKKFTINTSSLSVEGLDKKLEISYDSPTAEVTVKGKSSDVKNLTAAMLSGTINVSGMSAGAHSATVTFDLEKDYQIERVTVTFILKEKSETQGGSTQ